MKTLYWGTIGCGDVVERKGGPPLFGIEGCELVAVMRRDAEKAADYARRNHVPRWYDSVDDILADEQINAIYVATPDPEHEWGTIRSAEAGKHVLVEKAMATSTAACDRMIEACDKAGVILAVAYYRRCYPSILRAKELIDKGKIGDVKTMTINDEFPLSHRLDLAHFFFGDVDAVWSKVQDLAPGSYADRGPVLHVRSLSGVESIMNIGWDEKLAPETLDFVGTEGELHITDLKAGLLNYTVDGQTKTEQLPKLKATHWGLVENFLQHYNGQGPLACDGVEGRKSTVILDIVQELPDDSDEVKVDYDNPPGA